MKDWTPDPQESGWREPPRRRPPTAVGVATPPPPHRPRRAEYFETRMQRIGRLFSQMAFATACGLAAGEFVPMVVLASALIGLVGGRFILQRSGTRRARHILHLGSSSLRRAA
jgi:hypothetical protein